MKQKFSFLIYGLMFVGAFQDLLADKMPCLGDPPKMENGNAVIDFRLHGHYIRYKCHEGTKRTKIGSVRCHDGAWIGDPPICDFLPCLLDPPKIENGRAVIKKRHHGHYIRYECQGGAKKTKVGSIQCLNGTWTGETPNCDFKSCRKDPPIIENGRAIIENRNHGSYITYECQEGSEKTKVGSIQCDNGIWRGETPKCDFLSCLWDPPKVENGEAVIETRDHGHYIWYECQEGTKRIEMGNVHCHNGVWIGKTPKCGFPDCMTEDLSIFNLVTPFQDSVESSKSLDVHCKEGYRPARNAQVITCVRGVWNITEDPCIKENTVTDADCMTEDLSIFNLVTPFQESVESSKSLVVHCKEGYRPARNAQVITCMNGAWDITADPCINENIIKEPCLGDPPEIENGKAVIIDRDDGYIVWYTCEEGTIRTKFGDVRCKDGNWVGSPPRCAYPVCLTRDSYYPNMVMPSKEFVESSKSIDIVCKEGYRPPTYAKVITCMGGEWNITQDPCIEEEVSAGYILE